MPKSELPLNHQTYKQRRDEAIVKAITDFNIRDSGGMDDTENVKLCVKDAAAALDKLILDVVGPDEKLNGSNFRHVDDQNELRQSIKAIVTGGKEDES